MLITAIAIATAGYISYKVHDKYKDTCYDKKLELWKIQDDCEELFEEIKKLVKVNKMLYTKQFNALNKVREDVYNTTFTEFKEVAELITNIEFDNNLKENNVYASKLETITVNMPEIDVPSVDYDWNGGNIFAMAILSPVGMGLAKLGEFYEAIDKAELEFSQLEYDYEQIKTECDKVKSIYTLMATLRSTILNLQFLADNAIKSMKDIIEKSGYDFSSYSQKEKEHIFLTFKLVDAVNKLVNMQVINKNGNINTKLKRFIEVTSANVKQFTAECVYE